MTPRAPIVVRTVARWTVALLLPAAAGAQVGHPPERSPFQDLEYRQSVSAYSGYFRAAKDVAGVAPQSGPLVGARYDLYLGGPASLTVRAASVVADRTVLDPARNAGDRVIGTERRPLTMVDAGLTIGLTGQKSFRGLVPTLHTGAGIVSNLAGTDPGGYRFGTRFLLAFGAGIRYVPGGRWSARGDVGTHLYQIRYPDSYFAAGLDSTSVLPANQSKSAWTNNLGATVGISYHFLR